MSISSTVLQVRSHFGDLIDDCERHGGSAPPELSPVLNERITTPLSGHKCCSRKVEQMMKDMQKMVNEMDEHANETSIKRGMLDFIKVRLKKRKEGRILKIHPHQKRT